MKIEIDVPELPKGYELTENANEAELYLMRWVSCEDSSIIKMEWVKPHEVGYAVFIAIAKKKKPEFKLPDIYDWIYNTGKGQIQIRHTLDYAMYSIFEYKQFLKDNDMIKEGVKL